MEKLTAYLKAERGRLSKLAAALEINPSAISQWDEIPLARVVAVEKMTGIPRQELRPDFFAVAAASE